MDASPPPQQPGYQPYQQPLPQYAPRSGPSPWIWVLGGCGCVFFIIVILAAILFPVFAQARESARKAYCLSNVKQMGTAMLMYANDYDEHLPPSTGWMDQTQRYLKDERAYHCPSVPGADSSVFGYAYHSELSLKSMAKIADPRDTMMLYDSTTLTRNASDAGTSLPIPPRHVGGNNVGYADSHAAWKRSTGE